MTINEALLDAQTALAKTLAVSESKLEAQLLMQHVLNVNRAWLIAHENDALQANTHAEFEALVNRRLHGEPIAYILGYREFFGLKIKVSPDTLIPRPDTETLVEAALAKLATRPPAQILDLGTGTGAIALAIAKHAPHAEITAVDASKAALEIAADNAQYLNLTNISFTLCNWFQALNDVRFDLIVSNPPYIKQDDSHLNQGDLRFEPMTALASGADGLDDIRRIVAESLTHLKPQGWLMLEHGYNQASAVADLLAEQGFVEIATLKDFGGNDRVTLGKNPLVVSAHWA
jgi:release factor glutamine methyltransferase